MFDSIFALFALLFIKHWYVDFVNQTMEEVHGKGIYGNWFGVGHSIKQGLGTLFVFWLVTYEFEFSLIVAFIDFVLHYHIDWAKININKKYNYTVEMPQFWMWLGFDQLLHSLTYVFLIWLAL
jgi:hypothetical protein